uniref:Nicotinic acetylcholine receptor alpha 6 subunit isoform V n=1 Tax=Bactrocera dorsalis TaxID=27457 RepID=M4H4E2_BACDO|nr:nicotinic acetylcholine receptor alpha 6 subunit isoform V [Bactrocera dorsalis]
MDPSLLVVLIFLVIIKESCQGPHEKRLLNHLLSTYNTLERPVSNESEPLEVKFGLTLQQIIDVDEKNQILTTNAWLNLQCLARRIPSSTRAARNPTLTSHSRYKSDGVHYIIFSI